MQYPLLTAIACAALLCALLAVSFRGRLRPGVLPHRLVVLPVRGDPAALEGRLYYELSRTRQDRHTQLFLLDLGENAEASDIARRFCQDQPQVLTGDLTALRGAAGDEAVYKAVEFVLY